MEKLYFKTLVLAYFFFKIKESLAQSEKQLASEWKHMLPNIELKVKFALSLSFTKSNGMCKLMTR